MAAYGELSQGLWLDVGAKQIPHPSKQKNGGEDAYFVFSSNTFSAIGVADGVGGWASRGVDSGVYSRLLLSTVYDFFHTWNGLDAVIAPVEALTIAQNETKVLGSCTATVLVLQGRKLFSANLGDSGFMLVRKGDVVFASPPQQHSFNYPFQLSDGGKDRPLHADRGQHSVEIGDVLVVGSDGLFDNLFTPQILDVLNSTSNTASAASKLAELAHAKGGDSAWRSPFSVEAEKAGYARELGGKMDDITVLVAEVVASKSRATGTAANFRPLDSRGTRPPLPPRSRL
jgi:protein phosphatase PTC7